MSECDFTAERLIRKILNASFPKSGVVGEEGGTTGVGDLCWYIDPIDGTYNFIRGLPLFCVSVGYSFQGNPLGGCVYDPVNGEAFAAHGDRLWLNGRAVATPRQVSVGPPLVLTDLPNAGPGFAERDEVLLRNVLEHAEPRRIGSSALALAWVAVGRADAALNTDVYAWDVAAGRVLVTAAGGSFAALPDPVPIDRQGAFVAWLPHVDGLARRMCRSLGVAR